MIASPGDSQLCFLAVNLRVNSIHLSSIFVSFLLVVTWYRIVVKWTAINHKGCIIGGANRLYKISNGVENEATAWRHCSWHTHIPLSAHSPLDSNRWVGPIVSSLNIWCNHAPVTGIRFHVLSVFATHDPMNRQTQSGESVHQKLSKKNTEDKQTNKKTC